MTDSTTDAIIVLITGTIVFLLMALFGVGFILYYHKRQREVLIEKQSMQKSFEHELFQTQIEAQNHTLQQVAQELHDNIGQLLTVVVMRLNTLEDEATQPGTQQAIQQTRDLVRTVITDVRALSKTLDHDTVQRFGLLPSLTLELERIQRTGRIRTELITQGEAYTLGERAEIVLLRMAQESINNALKHAQAQNLTVSVAYKPEDFMLIIADDGKGFNPEEAYNRTLDQAGAGLNNLFRRTGLLGGQCTVDSRIGEGTRIQLQLPRNQIV